MRIDVHHHFLPPAHVAQEAQRIKNAHATPQARLANWSPQWALDVMGENGIDFAIASISTPGVWFGDAKEAAGLAQDWNDYAAAQTRAHPERFEFFATLPQLSITEKRYGFCHASQASRAGKRIQIRTLRDRAQPDR